jgi:heptosyltransferase-2
MISNCGLFVANDSGPMHLAASIGVPLIAIFGSTDPLHTGPRGEKCNIIYKKVSCSPCFERECNKDLECMKLIETNDVIKAAKELMGEVKM